MCEAVSSWGVSPGSGPRVSPGIGLWVSLGSGLRVSPGSGLQDTSALQARTVCVLPFPSPVSLAYSLA